MARRRKKKIVRSIYPSVGPLPDKWAEPFAGRLLVFSDASLRRHGGIAAVIFESPDAEPRVFTRTVTVDGSNALELQAALFALEQAERCFPGKAPALFSDNQDTVTRLVRNQTTGLGDDPTLQAMLAQHGIADTLARATISWIKGHGTCRGNVLADQHAAEAASGNTV